MFYISSLDGKLVIAQIIADAFKGVNGVFQIFVNNKTGAMVSAQFVSKDLDQAAELEVKTIVAGCIARMLKIRRQMRQKPLQKEKFSSGWYDVVSTVRCKRFFLF